MLDSARGGNPVIGKFRQRLHRDRESLPSVNLKAMSTYDLNFPSLKTKINKNILHTE